MSTCIGPQGEFGEHVYEGETLGSEFNCARCYAFDEDAADAEVRRLREQIAQRDEWIRLTVTHLAVLGRIDGGCGRTVVEALTEGEAS